MNLDEDKDLLWIAKNGLQAPLPPGWKACQTKQSQEIYYFNFSTGQSQWEHPSDQVYKQQYLQEKQKKLKGTDQKLTSQ